MVFIRKAAGKEPKCFTVAVTLGIPNNKITAGQVGIEIEVEGTKLPKEDDTPKPWIYHHDGSLRGQDNAEYVLHKPVEFAGLEPCLDKLWAQFDKRGSKIDESNRTSVHVHLNVQGFFLNRLTSFMALYFILEEVLTQWCGDHRVGNLFCLRAKDAPAVVSQIRQFIRRDMQSPLRDHHHYAALNANAIHKFGSLEFRALRGVQDRKVILDWVGVLKRLYDLSTDFPDPRTVCDQFSGDGPEAFFDNLLGEYSGVIREGSTMTNDEIRQSMYDGIRFAQDLCFCRDWSLFTGMSLHPDPFGRDPRKVAARINATVGEQIDAGLAAMYQQNMGHEGEFGIPIYDEEDPEDDHGMEDIPHPAMNVEAAFAAINGHQPPPAHEIHFNPLGHIADWGLPPEPIEEF